MRIDAAQSDADLARSIGCTAPGDASAAEEELYTRLAPRVRLYGLRHLRNAQAAADLVQQVLLKTIEHLRLGKIREPERLSSYVLGMCRMVVRDIKRGGWRHERVLRHFAADVPRVELSDSVPFDISRLAGCFAGLSERERSVLVLTFHADLSALEVSRELGLTATNVRVIRHRALRHLRTSLGGTEPTE